MTDLLGLLDRPGLFLTLAVVSTPLYVWVGSLFFAGWSDFFESARLGLQLRWLAVLRGEWHEARWETIRLLVYLVCCGAVVAALYQLAKTVL